MDVYAAFDDPHMPLGRVPDYAARAEAIGFAGLLVPEAVHDGFLASLLALEHTRRLRVATSVVLAFPRSPMTVAYAAWDLQALSSGRFALGLGSQIRSNIVGRFSTTWTEPVARMRDYVGALRAIWASWQSGAKLNYESKNYRFDRMQPFFNPGPIEHPDIPIHLGGVRPGMIRLAGEVADAVMTHPTNTSPRYLRECVLPSLREGRVRRAAESAHGNASRSTSEPAVVASTFVATGPDAETVSRERENIRSYLGFLYSTPQYEPTLELFGWQDLGARLRELARTGQWEQMTGAIGDEILESVVACASYAEIAPVLRAWYGALVQSITLRMPEDPRHDRALAAVIEELGRE